MKLGVWGGAIVCLVCVFEACSSGPSGGPDGGDGSALDVIAIDSPVTQGDSGPTLPPLACPDPPSGARVFYVDGAAGIDTNDGKSEATAFKTIGKAVSGLAPNDTVLVKKGLYRERVDMKKSGTASQRIVIRPFQQDVVVVDGSDSPGSWTLDSGSVYVSHPAFAVQAVVVDEVPLIPATSRGAMVAGQWFSQNGALYVWTPTSGDPGSADVGVVAVDDNKTQQAFYLDQASYVTVCGLTTRFAGAKGVLVLGDYDTVQQCKIEFNGGIGLSVGPYNSIQSTDALITGNEIRDNYMRNWPRCSNGYKNGGWGTGASSQNAPNTKFIGNIVHHNGGEGIVAYGGTQGATIQGNYAWDNWSVNLYVLDTQNISVTGNVVYSTGPNLADLTNNGDPSPSDNHCAKLLRPIGIATGDENLGGTNPLLDHVVIANNFMIGGRYATGHVAEVTGSGIKDVTIADNTVVLAQTAAAYENIEGFDLPDNSGNNAGTKITNNVVYGAGVGVLVNGTSFTGLSFDHNAWFHASNAKPFSWNGATYAHAAWVALASGQGAGDVLADPMLIDASSTAFDPAKKCPSSSSPVIDVGTDASISVDFFGTTRPQRSGFDIGACELK